VGGRSGISEKSFSLVLILLGRRHWHSIGTSLA
jgi:hypothetical protein